MPGPPRIRPVYFKELAQFLTGLREAEGWEQSHAADLAQRRGHKALTRQVLLRLENGQTKSPDPQALRGIAAIYPKATSYPDLVRRIVEERYGVRDLSRPTSTSSSTVPEGGEHQHEDLR